MKKRISAEQIVTILKQAELGIAVAALIRQVGVSERGQDQFQPGQTTLDGVSIPYTGWVSQMQSCPATMAQALVCLSSIILQPA